ncbi:MAG: hypothetical protein LBQ38_10460 [Spirochaetaceae bacterium]|nr:hypothetical protein [Spirochaetaceae bacterium]
MEEIRYPLYRFFGDPVFLSERAGIVIILSSAGLLVFFFLVYSAVCRRELSLQIRIGLRYSWVTALLFGVLYGSFFVSDRILQYLLTMPGIPPGTARYSGLGQTTLMGLIMFCLVTGFTHLLPIPKLPLFYGNAAVVGALTCFLAGLVWDITRAPVLLWALLCTILGRSLRKKAAVYGCALLYPAQALGALLDALRGGGLPTEGSAGFLYSHGASSFIVITLFLLPPLLLIIQGNALRGRKAPGRMKMLTTKGQV